jgi:hypothetical protein
MHVMGETLVLLVLLLMLLCLVASSRVGIVVNPRVSSQFV